MANSPKLFLFFSVLFLLCISSSNSAQSSPSSCSNYRFPNNKKFSTCSDLPYLNSALHWTYIPSSQTLQVAFRQTTISPQRWVAWAINPRPTPGMLGSQALIAYPKPDGTMRVYTSPVNSYQTGLKEGDLSFPVSDLSATYSNSEITIFATLMLHNISTTVNQVWQEGPLTPSGTPGMHPLTGPNMKSMGTLDLLSGESKGSSSGGAGISSRMKMKYSHGFLNTIGWGILIPLGAIIARYVKLYPSADPAWFYLHIGCQVSAFLIGAVGFFTGISLGKKSPGITHTAHMVIGSLIFGLATVQILAASFLRPKKDHKLRVYWNIGHYSVGYTILILGIINNFKGLHILSPGKKWEKAYIAVLVTLGAIALFLEVVNRIVVFRRKRRSLKADANTGEVNGTNGV
ncbi:OLC1v1023888C1 [Oldenlandia corymbosa var. corymbosa]|uniref:Cytochrome b561 and DOMON domain-containing protein n=1 Tax=Oldenlandia corymbosa var. corymbosa TaxID=529605 RepID=A0AAV1C0Z5_OLDCO|nr:OLC1v1023888C1 [Oldenlandia corymbosa var. corymbosa]